MIPLSFSNPAIFYYKYSHHRSSITGYVGALRAMDGQPIRIGTFVGRIWEEDEGCRSPGSLGLKESIDVMQIVVP